MNNLQATLLFPVRDAEARKQLLIASAIMLAGFVIPILPMLVVMGYGVKIMRQVIMEGSEPSMPEWQGSNLGALLQDGFRILAAQLVYTLPLVLLIGCGFIATFAGTGLLASSSDGNIPSVLGGLSIFAGMGFIMLISVLILPLGIVLGAVESHVVSQGSFQAVFDFKGWWLIFRKSLAQFLLSYLVVMAISMVLTFLMQIAMLTVVLICLFPFLMAGYSTYLMLVMNTLFAQSYANGRASLQADGRESA
jgi:hypothetical protein